MNYTITDIDLNEDSPECKTPEEIINYTMSVCNQVYPNIQPDIKGFEGMTDYQTAYSLTKALYDQATDDAERATDAECERLGVSSEDMSLEQWSEIDTRYDGEYAVNKLMFMKWQAEKLMVEESFRIVEADPKVRKQLAMNRETFDQVRSQWERPCIREKVINLAFKLKA